MAIKPNTAKYLKYSGMVFQIFGILALAAWLGQSLDKTYQTPKPYYTLILVTVGFAAVILWLYYDLFKTKRED